MREKEKKKKKKKKKGLQCYGMPDGKDA